jgi:hypothetical protein
MNNIEFNRLLSSAYLQLDELSKMVKETIKAEEDMIDKALTPSIRFIPPKHCLPVYVTWRRGNQGLLY